MTLAYRRVQITALNELHIEMAILKLLLNYKFGLGVK